MKILLVGSGGREYALALKLKGGAAPVELFAAPGSDALAELGTCLPLAGEDVSGIAAWCREARPDLVVVGPEAPLVAGLADALRALGIPVYLSEPRNLEDVARNLERLGRLAGSERTVGHRPHQADIARPPNKLNPLAPQSFPKGTRTIAIGWHSPGRRPTEHAQRFHGLSLPC